MNRQVEQMIPDAVAAVTNNLAYNDGKSVKSAYNGYVASYGAAITQSGLLAATAMFSDENKKSRTEGDKTCLMDAILEVLRNAGKIPPDETRLFDYVLAHQSKKDLLKQQILKASIAIKLAMRTFKLEK